MRIARPVSTRRFSLQGRWMGISEYMHAVEILQKLNCRRIDMVESGPLGVPQMLMAAALSDSLSRPMPGQLCLASSLPSPHLHCLCLVIRTDPLLSRHVPSQPGKSQASPTITHTRTCSSPVRLHHHEGPLFLHKGSPPTPRRLNHPGTAADRD